MTLIADLCVDEYTSHGHCGILSQDGTVDNDATLEIYNQTALAQADAGADICAPSGMMDGQVSSIRNALDSNNHTQTIILAYSAKYASSLYGPFRDAVDVTIKDGGDRRGYQQDHANSREALAEIKADISEGADIVMVKPVPSISNKPGKRNNCRELRCHYGREPTTTSTSEIILAASSVIGTSSNPTPANRPASCPTASLPFRAIAPASTQPSVRAT